ncbi:ubiquitin-2 like Rad60 SUMO-like-domain-containing protein [Phyllosticta capitalensis]
MSDAGTPQKQDAGQSEHLNIKVTDGNNEVFFKIKRTTEFKKLMHAFCERQGKRPNTVRFIFDGHRLNEEQRPSDVSEARQPCPTPATSAIRPRTSRKLLRPATADLT